jgi:putative resolvase
MKLADWAKATGISYVTAYRWFRQGIIPYETIQLPTGTILVYPDQPIGKAID